MSFLHWGGSGSVGSWKWMTRSHLTSPTCCECRPGGMNNFVNGKRLYFNVYSSINYMQVNEYNITMDNQAWAWVQRVNMCVSGTLPTAVRRSSSSYPLAVQLACSPFLKFDATWTSLYWPSKWGKKFKFSRNSQVEKIELVSSTKTKVPKLFRTG